MKNAVSLQLSIILPLIGLPTNSSCFIQPKLHRKVYSFDELTALILSGDKMKNYF